MPQPVPWDYSDLHLPNSRRKSKQPHVTAASLGWGDRVWQRPASFIPPRSLAWTNPVPPPPLPRNAPSHFYFNLLLPLCHSVHFWSLPVVRMQHWWGGTGLSGCLECALQDIHNTLCWGSNCCASRRQVLDCVLSLTRLCWWQTKQNTSASSKKYLSCLNLNNLQADFEIFSFHGEIHSAQLCHHSSL